MWSCCQGALKLTPVYQRWTLRLRLPNTFQEPETLDKMLKWRRCFWRLISWMGETWKNLGWIFCGHESKQPGRRQHSGPELYQEAGRQLPHEWVIGLNLNIWSPKSNLTPKNLDLHAVKSHVFTGVRVFSRVNKSLATDRIHLKRILFKHRQNIASISVRFVFVVATSSQIHQQESIFLWQKFSNSLHDLLPFLWKYSLPSTNVRALPWKHIPSELKFKFFGARKAASWRHCLISGDLDKICRLVALGGSSEGELCLGTGRTLLFLPLRFIYQRSSLVPPESPAESTTSMY